MKQIIESIINEITMYRLVLYGLLVVAVFAGMLSMFGVLQVSPLSLIASGLTLVAVSYGSSRLFARLFSTHHNRESWAITGLILFFLLPPPTSLKEVLAIGFVALLATASKYIVAVRQRHIFNPAAIAVVIAGLFNIVHASWWVATPLLLPVVAIVGLLIVWKVRRFAMVGIYIFVAMLVAVFVCMVSGYNLSEELSILILSSPLIFVATIMLTEPLTSPTTRKWQLIYAAVVGALTTWQLGLVFTPEIAICIGNLIAFAVGYRRAIKLKIVAIRTIAPSTIEVIARPLHPVSFVAGQYMELTLPHKHADARGVRRTFSIASAPSDDSVRFGLTVSEPGSSFKKELTHLNKGRIIRATQIGGDFSLPQDPTKPLVFIAGGIGITPFRAMLADLMARGEHRNIVLFYATRTKEVQVYNDVIQEAKKILNILYVPVVAKPHETWKGETGFITAEMIHKHVSDVKKRRIYISGPSLMVDNLRSQLLKNGIRHSQIVKDYFSGY